MIKYCRLFSDTHTHTYQILNEEKKDKAEKSKKEYNIILAGKKYVREKEDVIKKIKRNKKWVKICV